MLTPEGYYFNFTGTGNTLNCNNPVVRDHGARLPALLGRRVSHRRLPLRPGLDPRPRPRRRAAGQSAAAGVARLRPGPGQAASSSPRPGTPAACTRSARFPAYGRWAEWNGKYRDCVRRFLKGDAGQVGETGAAAAGLARPVRQARAPRRRSTSSPATTASRCATWSPTTTSTTRPTARTTATAPTTTTAGTAASRARPTTRRSTALRRRQIKNAVAMLLVSQGVPMMLMGDEVGRTPERQQQRLLPGQRDSAGSTGAWPKPTPSCCASSQRCIAFRKAHPVLRGPPLPRRRTPTATAPTSAGTARGPGMPTGPATPGRWPSCSAAAPIARRRGTADTLYVAMNMHWEPHAFELPACSAGRRWHVFANTALPPPEDAWPVGAEPPVADQRRISVHDRSVVVLVGRTSPDGRLQPSFPKGIRDGL